MSFSGAGLYDDDTASDVRARVRRLTADGLPSDQATEALVAEWGTALEDPDEAAAFWLALADTQAELSRLEPDVCERALAFIDTGTDLARFAHDPGLHARRRDVLAKLRRKIGR